MIVMEPGGKRVLFKTKSNLAVI